VYHKSREGDRCWKPCRRSQVEVLSSVVVELMIGGVSGGNAFLCDGGRGDDVCVPCWEEVTASSLTITSVPLFYYRSLVMLSWLIDSVK
jgi:hypothetical protein